MIVLGVDGMDPNFVERHWAALPNLRRLRERGEFLRLATTSPPQSPVAWSTFITGLPPSEHGIYDFVHRDPETLQPFSSLSRTEDPRFEIPFAAFRIPLSTSRVVSLRRGTPFWQALSEKGVPVTVVRMPANYPPAPFGKGLAGMGVPDLNGTLGTFSFFTDDPAETSHSVSGGRIEKIQVEGGRALLRINGPPNTLRKDRAISSLDLALDIDPDLPFARLRTDDRLTILQQGQWSEWLPLDFPLLPGRAGRLLTSVRGEVRIYVKQLHPRLQIYVSAVNADPLSPPLPLSYPQSWSREIAGETGPYFTLGIPEDTAALRQGVLTRPEFAAQTRLVAEDEHRLLTYSLRHFSRGLLFFYFSSVDQNSHILWGRYEDELLQVYRQVDDRVGEVRQSHPDASLIVLSDHGFARFDRAVHLNTWLRNHGFLASTSLRNEQIGLDNVDWSETKAYAIGLNGLYLNRAGREKQGIVSGAHSTADLIATLKQQLTAWRDPRNGRQIIEVLDESKPARENARVAPDLIVGYAPGYRASRQTAMGGTPSTELDDNEDAWIGDHCVNSLDVPGVLFLGTRLESGHYGLQDVTSLVLRLFQ